jgi:ankyrin repeat protein
MNIREKNLELASVEEIEAFFNAMDNGDLDTFRSMISKNPNILKWQTNWPTMLHRAVQCSPAEIVEYLLSLGSKVYESSFAQEYPDSTPIHYAAQRRTNFAAWPETEKVLNLLIEKGANVNAGAGKTMTPLHVAVTAINEKTVRYLLEHGADPQYEDEEGRTPLAVAIKWKREAIEALLREKGAPMKGIPVAGKRAKESKSMRVDLSRDAKKIRDYISKRVREQIKQSPDAPVTRIDLSFDYSHSGYVALHFDTRPNAEPGDERMQDIDEIELKMPQWNKAAEALGEKPVHFLLPDDSKRTVPVDDDQFNDEAYAALLGEMLKGLLLSARADGVFEKLRKAKRCELGIEDFEGHYGWPLYEDRGNENLV